MNETLIAILGIVGGSAGFWAVIQSLIDSKVKKRGEVIKEINDKLDNVATKDEVKELKEDIQEVKEELAHTKDVSLSNARDRLNHLCNKYTNDGYIPFDEFVSFKALGESYINAGGNTEIKTKFEWVMENVDPKATNK